MQLPFSWAVSKKSKILNKYPNYTPRKFCFHYIHPLPRSSAPLFISRVVSLVLGRRGVFAQVMAKRLFTKQNLVHLLNGEKEIMARSAPSSLPEPQPGGAC